MVVEVMRMKEENKGTPKNKWSRIYRKKWFFPALYLAIATILLSVVVWYQNVGQVPEAEQETEQGDDYVPSPYDEEAEAVVDQQEVIKMPVKDKKQAEIVTKFYDYNAEQEDQENALVLYNNRYYQSTGIDIAFEDGEPFDVIASLSGTVTEVKEDPLLGNVVVMDHENDVMTYYASLQEVDVKAGDKVKQGEDLGVAGKNLFGKDHGTHVHFEIRKDGKEVDPESYFDQPVSKLDEEAAEETTEEEKAEDEAPEEEKTEDDATDEENKEESSESEENKETSTEEGNEEKDNEKKSSEDEREGLSDDPSQNEDHESDRSDVNQDEQLTPNKDDHPFDR